MIRVLAGIAGAMVLSQPVAAQILSLRADDGVSCFTNNCVMSVWFDQVDGQIWAGGDSPRLKLSSSDFNFNPSINFSGTAVFQGPSGFSDFSSGITFYVVAKWNSFPRWSRILELSEAGQQDDNIIFANVGVSNGIGYAIYQGNSGVDSAFYGSIDAGRAQLFSTQQAGGASLVELFKAGRSLGSLATQPPTNVTRSLNYVGRSTWSSDGHFDGEIAEIILYDRLTASDEHQSIQSYLALKYGFTLDASLAAYTNTAFSTVYDIDATFRNSIAGLGRDTILDQRVSKSVTSAAELIVATDNDFASANTDNSRTALSAGQYLVWGHDNGAIGTTQASEMNTGLYDSRIAREWKITNTNTVGAVHMNVSNLPALGADQEYRLIYKTAPDFSSGTAELAASTTGVFNDVVFPAGTGYFTIALCSTTAELTAAKSVSVYDPLVEGRYNIPGSDVIHSITVTNVGDGPVDSNSIFLVDRIPEETVFYNGDIDDGGPETLPIAFAETGSGLSFNYAADIGYSSSVTPPTSFAECTYAPLAGYDSNVSHICINVKDAMHFGDPDPSFSISFRARIE